jgi:hypothetical protein
MFIFYFISHHASYPVPTFLVWYEYLHFYFILFYIYLLHKWDSRYSYLSRPFNSPIRYTKWAGSYMFPSMLCYGSDHVHFGPKLTLPFISSLFRLQLLKMKFWITKQIKSSI